MPREEDHMLDNEEIEIIDTSTITDIPSAEGTLFENRKKINRRYDSDLNITIHITAYNRLDKTKACIESIMKYTSNHKFKLLLVDNGSSDGTFEYFKTLKFSPKKIVRLTENKGSVLGGYIGFTNYDTKYIVGMTNDIIVTKNWLDNLMTCMESDELIWMVNPIVSNSSPYYLEPLPEIHTTEEAEQFGEKHNHSNHHLWSERLRIPSMCSLWRKEVFDIAGLLDVGFFHDFLEDDLEIRMRRAGYKIILAQDTFVHHNHYIQERDIQNNILSAKGGHRNYLQKHCGLEPWDDMDNYIYPYIKNLECHENCTKILGINTRCGQPLLDVKNRFQQEDIKIEPEDIFAFTKEAKYYDILYTITHNVICDNTEENLFKHYKNDYFDVIIIGEEINQCAKPLTYLHNVLNLLKKGGTLLLSLYNTYDFRTLFASIVNPLWRAKTKHVLLHYNDILETLDTEGAEHVEIFYTFHQTTEELHDIVQKVNHMVKELETNPDETYQRLLIEKYWFFVKK